MHIYEITLHKNFIIYIWLNHFPSPIFVKKSQVD